MRLIKCQCLGKTRLSPSHLCSTFLMTHKMSQLILVCVIGRVSLFVRQWTLVTWVWTAPLGEWVWDVLLLGKPACNWSLCPWLCYRSCAGLCVYHLGYLPPNGRWGITPVHPWMLQGFSSAVTWWLSESIPGNQKGWLSLWNFKENSLAGCWLFLPCHFLWAVRHSAECLLTTESHKL